MKIVFTGGITGGHFYPLIAVAEAVHQLAGEQQLVAPKLYFLSPEPFDEQALFENDVIFIKNTAGKIRRYFSLRNFTDFFKTIAGFFSALVTLFQIYPDVIFSKGGYASVPVVLAAAVLRIPIIIHESDSKPGRATLLAARFATRIAVSFDSSIAYFSPKIQSKIAVTGVPIRTALLTPEPEGARQELALDTSVPTILILGGSLGATRINEMVLSALPDLVSFANIIHQTGKDNIKEVEATARIILEKNANASRYHPFAYLNKNPLREAAGAADLVISRAGATAITEIALWHKPAILIPIPEVVSHDQRTNAYGYARTGAAVVLEEENMTPHVLASEARRIATNPALAADMAQKGSGFANANAARTIAEELVAIGLSHEPETLETATV